MIARWCISIFIFTLTLFGVVSQQQLALPNQEIVLQFTDIDSSLEEVQGTISAIKKQLQELGAENIQVNTEEGHVNIAYYSSSDAASIKKTLSNGSYSTLSGAANSKSEKPSTPSKKNNGAHYNFDVFEIQNSDGHGRNLNGNLVLKVETKSNRFLEPNFHPFCNHVESKSENIEAELVYTIRRNIALSIKETPHKIPEGRAGPAALLEV